MRIYWIYIMYLYLLTSIHPHPTHRRKRIPVLFLSRMFQDSLLHYWFYVMPWTPLFVPDFEEEYYHFSILHSFNIMHYYIISAWPFLGLSECTIFYVKYLHSKLNMSKQVKQLRCYNIMYSVTRCSSLPRLFIVCIFPDGGVHLLLLQVPHQGAAVDLAADKVRPRLELQTNLREDWSYRITEKAYTVPSL